ncbi:cytochrome b5-like heme/steroid binding domain-containing protein [Xylariaceae sp. FL1019]|nr:cytochrome b5-like heme/steroid binding domain-containing protein [Xylariaceae sp. FL1019]
MASTTTQQSEPITLEQLASHGTEESLWIAVHGHVYDLTDFRVDHPGGVDALLSSAGTDGTEAYEYAAHSEGNMATMQRFRIGKLAGSLQDADADDRAVLLSPVQQARRTEGAEPSRGQHVLRQATLAAIVIVMAISVAVCYRYLSPHLSASGLRPSTVGSNNTVWAFWAGTGLASSISFVAFRYIYSLFLSSLEFQSDVFKYPPTIPRKHKPHVF